MRVWAEGTVQGRTNAVPFGTDIPGIDISKIPACAQAAGVRYRLEEPAHYTFGAYTADRNALGQLDYRSLFLFYQITEGLTVFNPLLYAGCTCRAPV